MCAIPFTFIISCTFALSKVWLYAMLSLVRLCLRPLLPIASTMCEKQEGSVFQSVVSSVWSVYPQTWKLKKLVLYLSLGPKSSALEQWTEHLWIIIRFALQAALTNCCRSASLNSYSRTNTSLVTAFAAFESEFMSIFDFIRVSAEVEWFMQRNLNWFGVQFERK